MNTAAYVDALIDRLKNDNGIPLSEKCWQTAIACVGWAYVFGAWGAYCTVNERKQRYKYNAIQNILSSCQRLRENNPKGSCSGCKWFPDGEKTRCFDCRGFDDWVLKQFGFDLIGEGATSQWNTASNWCIKSDDMSAIPQGVLVNIFIYEPSKNNMKHTGFYYNGQTCECSSGVQHFTTMKKNRWTHWAVAKCFESELLNTPHIDPVEPPVSGNDKVVLPTIRRGDKGEKVAYLQKLLMDRGYALPKYGADGDFGAETEKAVKAFQRDWGLKEDGVVGEKTWSMLLTTMDKPKHYEVTITGLSEGEAEALCNKYPGAIKKEMVS